MRLIITVCVILFVLINIRACYEGFHGPSPEQAFRRHIKDPIPPSVKNIRLEFFRHMKGYYIWLAFDIDPADLESLFPLKDFKQVNSYYWNHEKTFRRLDPHQPMEMKTAWLGLMEGDMTRTEIALSDDRRKVYYFRESDSDIRYARQLRQRAAAEDQSLITDGTV